MSKMQGQTGGFVLFCWANLPLKIGGSVLEAFYFYTSF